MLLTAPREVIAERLGSRLSNPYGRSDAELARVLADLESVEPLLRRTAHLVLEATVPLTEIADELLAHVAERR